MKLILADDFDEDKNRIEVGMSIERAFWGNGFATEALEPEWVSFAIPESGMYSFRNR